MLSQRGGVTSTFSVIPVQYSLVKADTIYLLFLRDDKRQISDNAGLKRYTISGIWSGLFSFQDGRMIPDSERVDPLRGKYVGLSMEQILNEVITAVAKE